jgi:hypothetical protein
MAQAEGRTGNPLATALPFAVFALLALISWNRWLEPYVDSGRELMVPWRVAGGERLYSQIEFHHGPLAPYLGAAMDRVFGRSLPARTGLAALVGLLNLAALFRLAKDMLPAARAALAASIAVAAAFFLRPGAWLFPFSFDAAIAVAAVTGALALAGRHHPRSDAFAGACLAAALLARLEIGLAAVAVLVVACRGERRRLRFLAAWPLAAAAAGYAAVSIGIPFRTLEAEGWLRLLSPPEAYRNVYRAYAGLDRPGLRLTEVVLTAVVVFLLGAWLSVASIVSAKAARASRSAARAIEIVALAALAILGVLRLRPPAAFAETAALFPPLVRVVPIVVGIAAVARLVARLRGRDTQGPLARVPDAALWIAALFGARLLLAAGYIGPYDAFFLPLPLLVTIAGLFGLAERLRVSGSGALGPLPRLVTGALTLFLLVRIAALAQVYRRPGWSRVETPAGSVVLPEPVASTTRLALEDLALRLPERGTLAGFPEAGFFNYVLGRRNPYAHEQYFPGHLDGEEAGQFARELSERPPDAVIYANVLAVGEGARVFGQDYNEALDRAIRARTQPAILFGPGAKEGARIGDPDFFVEVRVPAPAAAPTTASSGAP